jgi:cytidylate kinase
MTSPELNHQDFELAPKQEASLHLIHGTRAVIIFGRIGVGQSNLGENVASCLGGVALYDGGRKIRTATGNTSGTTEFMPRDISVDNDIDEAQKILIRQASPDKPVVIVAKLGGYNALRLTLETPSIKVVRVLVTCSRDEAMRRVRKRKLREINETREKLDTQLSLGEISTDEYAEKINELFIKQADAYPERILHETQEREKRDLKQWAKAYPELTRIDVFNPAALI